ncbi:hypothetical protein GC176_22290 [bacterium]|nr:hypothetical protein [bacterium]
MSESLELVTEAPLFAGYQPVDGVFDELFAPLREPHAHCRPLVNELNRLGREELDQASRRAAQLLRDNGVTFNAYDEHGESSRPWQLDVLPTMLSRTEFQFLDTALIQRATLLEHVLVDLFGEQRLLSEKVLPPDIVFGHPGFHRAYHQLQPVGLRRLTVYAADLARSPDGRWWATGDRTRAPSGLGFVLENRIVMSRVLPGPFRAAGIRRLAPFFAQLRESLRESAPRFRDNPRIVLLSRGPDSATYFEDVYLARYLGYTLAEGGDLAVREGRVMLKTLGGLLPIEVILRRVSDDDCDPVELNPASLTGVSGLVDVVRNQNVVVANSLGSRLAETPAFVPFLRNACRFLLDEDLKLPSIATWWCGDPTALSYVLDHLNELIIQPAFFVHSTLPVDPSLMTNAAREKLIGQLRARPADFVAQERIARSTVPVWLGEGRVEPWHAAFRMFLTADGDSFQTLPGGLARVSPDRYLLDRSMTAGQRAQDVWVESDGPVETVTLLRSPDTPLTLMRSGNDLPSRDADNLFWLGRMIERADGAARVFRVVLQRVSGSEDETSEVYRGTLLRALAALGQIEPGFAVLGLQESMPDLEHNLPQAVFNTQESRSLKSTVQEVSRLADSVRDRLSLDAWRTLSKLAATWNLSGRRVSQLDSAGLSGLVQQTINSVALFGGLSNESMTRTQVWRFLELGRRIERVWNTATLLQSTLVTPAVPEQPVLETLLEACDSILTYRTRYLATLQAEPVVDLLVVDATNPRSLLFQLERIQEHVSHLPFAAQAVLGPDERLALSLHNAVQLAEPHELCRIELDERPTLDRLMQRLIDQTPRLSESISQRYLIHAGLPRRFGED